MTFGAFISTRRKEAKLNLRDINTPEHIILEQMKKEALYQAISALPAADQALVQGLFFKGQSELDYAREIGVSQPAVHKRKVRILKSLKKLLEN